ncbi:MAG: ABC transporter substrate-binding protein [Bacteroidales bacterium]|jgi:iron complex transport system substrate-binding protein|nr:ABC transporter substrate-binding protein [Bacteroidales bacterium]
MRTISFFLLLFLGIITSCHQVHNSANQNDISEKAPYYFEISDSYNRPIKLDREPQAIISISPSITEMLLLLHQEQRLIGITDFCPKEQQLAHVKRIGGLYNLNIESLLVLNPDLVLIGSIVSKNDVDNMEKVGLKVMAIKEEKHIDGLFNALSILGRLLNCDSLAQHEITVMRSRLEQLTSTQTATRKVYYVVGFGSSGDYTAPKESHIDEIITLAGAINVGHNLTNWNISREYLFAQQPDLIFIRKEDYEAFIHTYPYTKLNAVQQQRVYPIESSWIDIVSPKNLDAIELIHNKLEF